MKWETRNFVGEISSTLVPTPTVQSFTVPQDYPIPSSPADARSHSYVSPYYYGRKSLQNSGTNTNGTGTKSIVQINKICKLKSNLQIST